MKYKFYFIILNEILNLIFVIMNNKDKKLYNYLHYL